MVLVDDYCLKLGSCYHHPGLIRPLVLALAHAAGAAGGTKLAAAGPTASASGQGMLSPKTAATAQSSPRLSDLSTAEMESMFEEFIVDYEKTYADDDEKAMRFEIFKRNLKRIDEVRFGDDTGARELSFCCMRYMCCFGHSCCTLWRLLLLLLRWLSRRKKLFSGFRFLDDSIDASSTGRFCFVRGGKFSAFFSAADAWTPKNRYHGYAAKIRYRLSRESARQCPSSRLRAKDFHVGHSHVFRGLHRL